MNSQKKARLFASIVSTIAAILTTRFGWHPAIALFFSTIPATLFMGIMALLSTATVEEQNINGDC